MPAKFDAGIKGQAVLDGNDGEANEGDQRGNTEDVEDDDVYRVLRRIHGQ